MQANIAHRSILNHTLFDLLRRLYYNNRTCKSREQEGNELYSAFYFADIWEDNTRIYIEIIELLSPRIIREVNNDRGYYREPGRG